MNPAQTNKTGKTVAIIPARGGSKRIPGKNLRPFCGKPIIAYSIEKALASDIFDAVLVTTDDENIAQTSLELGAETPFQRPDHLADDFATTMDVIKHALTWLGENRRHYDHACCIYPTAPFIRLSDLKKGLELIKHPGINFAFPVTTFPSSIFRALKQTQQNQLKMFWPEHLNTRTQDLPEAYHDVGQFYWGKTNAFLNCNSIFEDNASPIIVPRHLAQDIDTLEDWEQAELMYEALMGVK